MEEADTWEILSSHAVELMEEEEEDHEQHTALGEQEEEYFDMSRPQLTVSAPKKGMQVAGTSE
jgi:hypothetical protein